VPSFGFHGPIEPRDDQAPCPVRARLTGAGHTGEGSRAYRGPGRFRTDGHSASGR
jgi:hypothetical protein